MRAHLSSLTLALVASSGATSCNRFSASPAQDIRAPTVQDQGTIGAAYVERVEARAASSSRGAGGTYSRNLWAHYRFRHAGDWVRSRAGLGAAGRDDTPEEDAVAERWFLAAYAPSDPRQSYLLYEWPISELRVVTASVTSVTRSRIPKGRRFAVERETGVRTFAYRVDGRRYEAEEPIGPATPADVGRTVDAMVRRDDPSQARLVDPTVRAAMQDGEMFERGRELTP